MPIESSQFSATFSDSAPSRISQASGAAASGAGKFGVEEREALAMPVSLRSRNDETMPPVA